MLAYQRSTPVFSKQKIPGTSSAAFYYTDFLRGGGKGKRKYFNKKGPGFFGEKWSISTILQNILRQFLFSDKCQKCQPILDAIQFCPNQLHRLLRTLPDIFMGDNSPSPPPVFSFWPACFNLAPLSVICTAWRNRGTGERWGVERMTTNRPGCKKMGKERNSTKKFAKFFL